MIKLRCLRCRKHKYIQKEHTRRDRFGTLQGFCSDCWEEIDKSGKCIDCGAEEDLFIHAMWYDQVIEHICGYCRDAGRGHAG